MGMTDNFDVESSSREDSGGRKLHENNGKYARYTPQQLEVLEKVFAECPKPSYSRRQQMICQYSILRNVESKQIKVWFQNRRFREKQRNDSVKLQSVNEKLTADNKLLLEENDRLQKLVARLLSENQFLREHLENVSVVTTDTSEAVVNFSQPSSEVPDNITGLILLAEETRREFLPKATGCTVDWAPIPGMKPGPDLDRIVYISHNCEGVAAWARTIVPLDPIEIMEILKDRPSWFRDCRKMEVLAKFPARDGGTIELIYMQFYAPTTLAMACNLWTLRYTSSLEDGSLMVCEKSVPGSGAVPSLATVPEFVRAKMLASGYLIRRCEGGGSILHIVDHLNFEASDVPEVIRPLYESPEFVAQKMTVAALDHIRQIAKEEKNISACTSGKDPAVFRSFGQRLGRGFNDAVNSFSEDGWSLVDYDAAEDLIISIKSAESLDSTSKLDNAPSSSGGVLCVKTTMLLQNVPPALLIRVLRERRAEWADFSVDASQDAGKFAFPGLVSAHVDDSGVLLGHTHNDEILEIIRVEGHALRQKDAFQMQNVYLLQICNGVEENRIGACSELIFAPIHEMLPNTAVLLSSGFRILSLPPSNMHAYQDASSTNLDTSTDTCRMVNDLCSSDVSCSVLTIAFQFLLTSRLKEDAVNMARRYVCNVISYVGKITMAIVPFVTGPRLGLKLTPDHRGAAMLANQICESYRSNVGGELLNPGCQGDDSMLKKLWHHQDAILCCSFKVHPVCLFANIAGLNMLETTFEALKNITIPKVLGDSGQQALNSVAPAIMQQGYAILPEGICLSAMEHYVSYKQAVVWKVPPAGEGNALSSLAFAFINWSFV